MPALRVRQMQVLPQVLARQTQVQPQQQVLRALHQKQAPAPAHQTDSDSLRRQTFRRVVFSLPVAFEEPGEADFWAGKQTLKRNENARKTNPYILDERAKQAH